MKKIEVLISWDRNYGAHLEVGDGIVVMTGQTLDEVEKDFTEALESHLEWMRSDGDDIPAEFQGEYELDFRLSTQALLKYSEGIVSRKALSRVTGINQQQLSHYASGWRNPRPEMQQRIVAGIHALGNQLLSISL